MTNALTVIIPEATANASMRRSLVIDFSLTERKTPVSEAARVGDTKT